jgi:glycerol-3-phosphate O-acyltransferase/dihydroxyacetone phosphate acyltransferase
MARSPSAMYRLTSALIRLGVRIFYRRVVTHTLEHVPPRGPAILAATHPNSITDPLVLGACLPRPIHYVAHSGLFRKPVLGWLLPRCGVIAVYRPEDFREPVDNSVMFRECTETLAAGEVIGIFPEGTSHQEERVKKLRTGTARIALEAEDRYDFALGVQIVPVGLNFQSPGRFRSDVLVLIGPPLVLHPYRRAYREDPVRAVQEVTAELQRRLERLVLELPAPDFVPVVRQTLRLLREPGDGGTEGVLLEHFAAREVGEALGWAARERPLEYARYARLLEEHARRRRRLGVSDGALASGPASPPPPGAAALAGLPLALVGAATHAVPYRLTGWVARRLRPDPTKLATVTFCAGALLFPLWYALQGAAVWLLWGPRASLVYLAALLPAGWLAMRYLPAWKVAWSRARGALVRPRSSASLERLRTQRRMLAAAARDFWDAFKAAREAW